MGSKERGIQKGSAETPQYPLYLSGEFKDYAERCQAEGSGPTTYTRVVMVQWIRRHPWLKETIEGVAGKFGKTINLTKRLI